MMMIHIRESAEVAKKKIKSDVNPSAQQNGDEKPKHEKVSICKNGMFWGVCAETASNPWILPLGFWRISHVLFELVVGSPNIFIFISINLSEFCKFQGELIEPKECNCDKQHPIVKKKCCLGISNSCLGENQEIGSNNFHHLTKGEHICQICYVELWKSGQKYHSKFTEWKLQWSTESRCKPKLKSFAQDQVLPYWLQCSKCNKYRCQPLDPCGKPPTREDIAAFHCTNCKEPEDEKFISVRTEEERLTDVRTHLLMGIVEIVEMGNDGGIGAPEYRLQFSRGNFRIGLDSALQFVFVDGGWSFTELIFLEARISYREAIEPAVDCPTESSALTVCIVDKVSLAKDISFMHSFSTLPYLQNSPTAKYLHLHYFFDECGMSPIVSNYEFTQQEQSTSSFLYPFHIPEEQSMAFCFRPDVMEYDEHKAFHEFNVENTPYLALRNLIVTLWTINPFKYLSLPACLPYIVCRGLSRIWHCELAKRVHSYLEMKGAINFGILEFPKPIKQDGSKKQLEVIIIGGGISGLTAARQLRSMGAVVKLLEAKAHVGGRMQDDWSLGVAVGCGAQLVTGTINNPIVLMCEQLGVNYRTVGHYCPLVDAKLGRLVDPKVDRMAEEHFNCVLDGLFHGKTHTKGEDRNLYGRSTLSPT
ncbi:hypothetical protein WR25_02203 [Diploscapter pachys]|uniref:SWIRM domain-containing protein n=1 Tax=Diploscapter pachys TaxID=2018661 RepID=A0A2A2J9J9_9BILA|nr:hypothetical protein WR25_02203 [Diploscapter pachys]